MLTTQNDILDLSSVHVSLLLRLVRM